MIGAKAIVRKDDATGIIESIQVITSSQFVSKNLADGVAKQSEAAMQKYFPYMSDAKRRAMFRGKGTAEISRKHLRDGWKAAVSQPAKGVTAVYLRHKDQNDNRVMRILSALEYGSRSRITYGAPLIAFGSTVNASRTSIGKKSLGKAGAGKITVVRKYVETPSREGQAYSQKTYDDVITFLRKKKVEFTREAASEWSRRRRSTK